MIKQGKVRAGERTKIRSAIDKRRGDVSTLAERPTPANVRRGAGATFSIRLSTDELEQMRQLAQSRNLSMSELVRQSVLGGALNITWGAPLSGIEYGTRIFYGGK